MATHIVITEVMLVCWSSSFGTTICMIDTTGNAELRFITEHQSSLLVHTSWLWNHSNTAIFVLMEMAASI